MKYILNLLLMLAFVNSLCDSFIIKLEGTGDFTEIQAGINAAVDSDTVLVYPGTYVENIRFNGKLIAVASLYLTTEDRSYIHNTIIDGNQNGSVVLFDESGESNEAVLCGFTIINGSGEEIFFPFYQSYGGGICIRDSSPTLKNLIIEDNQAIQGGGIYCRTSESYLEDVTIRYNHAYHTAGGFSYLHFPVNQNSGLIFSTENRCNIYNNYAGDCNDIYVPWTYEGVVEMYVDTLSVYDYDNHFVSNFSNLIIDVQHGKYEQVNCDLYVSPEGSDENTGFTVEDPLQTLHLALAKIKSDPLNPKTIYLSRGLYSASSNSQYFSVNGKSHVRIIGADKNDTILDGENTCGLYYLRDDVNCYLSDLSIINGYSLSCGGINCLRSSLYLDDILVENCTSISYSGISFNGGYLEGDNVEISNNTGSQAIGISKYFDVNSSCYFSNLIVAGNEPYYEEDKIGGGVHINNCLEAVFINTQVIDNTTFSDTWPISNFSIENTENAYLINSTICNNHSNYGGGMGFQGPGNLYLINSIIYDNEPYEFVLYRSSEPGYINFDYSNIDDQDDFILIADSEPYAPEIIWGEGWIREDPQFVGGDEADPLYYQLSETSPCINTGIPDTTGLNLPEYDLLGNPRIWDGRIDMGCYEYFSNNSGDSELPVPKRFKLCNYPNPFNPSTTISFYLPIQGDIQLNIYSITGQLIRRYTINDLESGYHETVWDGKDSMGTSVASGIYLYQLLTGDHINTKRMLLLK